MGRRTIQLEQCVPVAFVADGAIVARDGAVTALIEVKSAPGLFAGAARVDPVKQRRLRAAAEQWMRETGETNIRFDILEQSDAGFRYIRGAF